MNLIKNTTYENKLSNSTLYKRECHESYFEPKDLRKRNINLYFPILKNVNNVTLYYGYTKIADIKLKVKNKKH